MVREEEEIIKDLTTIVPKYKEHVIKAVEYLKR